MPYNHTLQWSLVFILFFAGSADAWQSLDIIQGLDLFNCMQAPIKCHTLRIVDFMSYEFPATNENPLVFGLIRHLFDHFLATEALDEQTFGLQSPINLKNLKTLEIYSNTLTSIMANAFMNSKKLLELNLANNNIAYVDEQAFNGLRALKSLKMSENFITSLSVCVFKNAPALRFLNLASNQLSKLELDLFLFNPHLVTLDLSSNGLQVILAPTEMKGFVLSHLILRNNVLKNIAGLKFLPKLKILDVSANQLSQLDPRDGFKQLKQIDISQNHWQCKVLEDLVRYLQSLNIKTEVLEIKTRVKSTRNINGIGCDTPDSTIETAYSSLEAECGQTTTTSSNANRTVRGELPWLVQIYQQTPGSIELHCAGTLVSKNIVVTAAHCIHQGVNKTLGLQEAVLFIGRFDTLEWLKKDYETRAAREFIVHPDYKIEQGDQSVANVALIVMKQPVEFSEFIQPICLPNSNEGDRMNYLLTGWERDEFGALESGVPQKTKVPFISNHNCRVHNRPQIVVTSRTICVGGKNWRGPCNVDSGGAIISAVKQRWFLSGVMSTSLPDAGIRFCNLKRYNIFTKVSEFSLWITSYINRNQ